MTEALPEAPESAPGFLRPEAYYDESSWLVNAIKRRNENKKNFICAATGDPGATKTYWQLYWAEKADPDFDVEVQCVWMPKGFWDAMENLPTTEWRQIVWDDPTAGLNKRDWADTLNKNVSKFIQTSSRYRKKNLSFPLPAYEDLDKSVRKVCGYEAMMTKIGFAKLYRCKPNRFPPPEVWKRFLGLVRGKVPKCAEKYEKMRDEFTHEYFEKSKFEEETPEEKANKEIDRANEIYETILKDPKPYTDSVTGKITWNRIVGDRNLRCPDKVARRVIAILAFEGKLSTVESNTSASAAN